MKKTILFLSILLVATNLMATVYEVGPGKEYEHIYDVPLKKLQAGDIIKVYAKSTPYKEKFMIYGPGTQDNPIQLIGIPDSNGKKPVIDGKDAVTGKAHGNYFYNEDRSVIKVGQNGSEARYVIIDGFEIKNADRHYSFKNNQGKSVKYISNAAGIHIEKGYNVIIKNCDIHHNENGIQSSNNGTYDILLESCHIHDNGVGDPKSAYQHNLYIGGGKGSKITIQYCKFGEILNDGQQLKIRVESIVFRYNWIEGGKNSQMDIVDQKENGKVDSYVYGNVIVKPETTNNGRLIHYGQDMGNHNGGKLHFFNNTVIIKSKKPVYLFRLSSNNRTVAVSNNIFYKTGTNSVKLLSKTENSSKISGSNNWFYEGTSNADYLTNSIMGSEPKFTNVSGADFSLQSNSPVKDIVSSFTFPAGHKLDKEYVKDLKWQTRPTDGKLDLGAYEYGNSSPQPLVAAFSATPTSGNAKLKVNFTDASTGNPTKWAWDFGTTDITFGNNTNANSQNPQVTFNSAGTYTIKLTVTNENGNNTKTASDYITVKSPTGIFDSEENLDAVKIYPNPTKNFIYVESPTNEKAHIYNTDGKKLKTIILKTGKNELNIFDLPTGIYILKVKSSNYKFVKQ